MATNDPSLTPAELERLLRSGSLKQWRAARGRLDDAAVTWLVARYRRGGRRSSAIPLILCGARRPDVDALMHALLERPVPYQNLPAMAQAAALEHFGWVGNALVYEDWRSMNFNALEKDRRAFLAGSL